MVSCSKRETKTPKSNYKIIPNPFPSDMERQKQRVNLMSQIYIWHGLVNKQNFKIGLTEDSSLSHPLLVPPNKAVPLISAGCFTSSKNCYATCK